MEKGHGRCLRCWRDAFLIMVQRGGQQQEIYLQLLHRRWNDPKCNPQMEESNA